MAFFAIIFCNSGLYYPEGDVSILTPEVYPIDSNSVSYSFSSTISPLLHNAARALNHERSAKTFYSVFHSSSNASSTHAEGSPPSTIITHSRQRVQHLICPSQIFRLMFRTLISKTALEYSPRPDGEQSCAPFVPAIDL